jgi:bacterioferritin-associated ferredoxin
LTIDTSNANHYHYHQLLSAGYPMIICICKNINSSTIKETLNKGVTTIQGVREHTGATSCCGKCQFKVNGLIQDHLISDEPQQLVAQNL